MSMAVITPAYTDNSSRIHFGRASIHLFPIQTTQGQSSLSKELAINKMVKYILKVVATLSILSVKGYEQSMPPGHAMHLNNKTLLTNLSTLKPLKHQVNCAHGPYKEC